MINTVVVFPIPSMSDTCPTHFTFVHFKYPINIEQNSEVMKLRGFCDPVLYKLLTLQVPSLSLFVIVRPCQGMLPIPIRILTIRNMQVFVRGF
jgi:hypothetical protein